MKLGFIGMGNMAMALCEGFIASELINKEDIYGYAPHFEKLTGNAERIGFIPERDIKEMICKTDVIIMACKPYQIEGVLSQIADEIKGKVLISVAAGWGFSRYCEYLDESVRVQFVMPNTPALVGEGVMLFESDNSLLPDERAEIIKLFSSVGMVEELPSSLMGIGGALTGCGPAFVDLFIEAYADAAVKYGIQRKTAYKIISQMILGSAKLQIETGEHPGVLKDNVCSPNGTTIRGVAALEKAGFRNACITCIDEIMEK